MASRSARRQAAILTIGRMVAHLAESQPNAGLLKAFRMCVDSLEIGPRDMKRINVALESFRRQVWADGMNVCEALSMLVCLIADQVVLLHGRKKVAFQRLLQEFEALLCGLQHKPDHERAFSTAILFTGLDF